MGQLQLLASRLHARAEKDEHLALTKCSEPDSFVYVMGRARTLRVLAEELAALEVAAPTSTITVARVDLEALRIIHRRNCQLLDGYHCSCGATEHNTRLASLLGDDD